MKKTVLFSFGIIAMMLTSCISAIGGNVSVNNGKDSDATVKKEIKLGSFNEIEAAQGIKVVVSQGKYLGKVSVATTPSAEEYLQVKVEEKTLKVYYENNSKGDHKIKGPSIITVTVPQLDEVDLSSGAYFFLKGSFNSASKMEFDLSSGSSVNIENLICQDLSIDSSSGAAANVEYFKGNLEADSSSGSSINIAKADGGSFDFSASSGSSINANSVTTTSIKASASSGASINLSGKTERLSKKSSSGGSVNTGSLKSN